MTLKTRLSDSTCPFCGREAVMGEERSFSVERKLLVHDNCMKDALEQNPPHPLAVSISEELKMWDEMEKTMKNYEAKRGITNV